MGKTIVVTNGKGGVGKTTTVASIGSILAKLGYRVLCLDFDYQGDLRTRFKEATTEINIYDILMENEPLKIKAINTHLGIIPASTKLTHLERDYKDKFPYVNHQNALKELIEPLKDKVDFILIDTPPDIFSFSVLNALVCADYVLIASQPTPNSNSGITQVKDLIKQLNKAYNPDLELLGIAITMFKSRTNIHSDVLSDMKEIHGKSIFNSIIRDNIDVDEISAKGRELIEHDEIKLSEKKVKIQTMAHCVEDYTNLTNEILERINK